MSTETLALLQVPLIDKLAVQVGTKRWVNCESHRFSDTPPFIIFKIPGYVDPHQNDLKSQVLLDVAAEHGASVVFFNYYGQGPEDKPPVYGSFQSYWRDTRAVFHELEPEIPVIVVTQSMGGSFFPPLAQAQNVVGITAIAPVIGFMDEPIKRGEELVREGGLGWERFAGKLTQNACRENEIFPFLGAVQYSASYLMGYRKHGALKFVPENMKKPVAIIASRRDMFIRKTHVDFIAERTNAGVHWVDKARHPMTDAASLEVLGDVLQKAMVPAALQHHVTATPHARL